MKLYTHFRSSAAFRVRIALHTGEADQREGDYFGSAVNRAARVAAASKSRISLRAGAPEGSISSFMAAI